MEMLKFAGKVIVVMVAVKLIKTALPASVQQYL